MKIFYQISNNIKLIFYIFIISLNLNLKKIKSNNYSNFQNLSLKNVKSLETIKKVNSDESKKKNWELIIISRVSKRNKMAFLEL